MVSMTSRTGRSAQITSNGERLVMNTFTVPGKLVGRDRVSLHVGRIRMAPGAGLRDIGWMDTRTCVARRTEVMHTMAIGTDSNLAITLGQQSAMHASLILVQLVSAQRGIVLTHECRVGVALPAQRWNCFAIWLATKPCRLAHRIHVGLPRVPTVATGAGQSFLEVDILSKLILRNFERRVQCRMAIDARVRALGPRRTDQHQGREQGTACSDHELISQ
jgi:hypothetical protein